MADLNKAKELMREKNIDCWLVHDFRGNNPVFWQLLGKTHPTTRRAIFIIPADGVELIIANSLDKHHFEEFGYNVIAYRGWVELSEILGEILKPFKKVAMEYSPNSELPMSSWVDAGTLEWLRSFGIEIESSADIYQSAAAVWSNEQLDSHYKACEDVSAVKDMAFDFIRDKLSMGENITEWDVKKLILEQFDKRKMFNFDGPVVAVDANASNPHYEPSETVHSPIKPGCAVLMDIWARYNSEQDIFCDITWVGFAGDVPSKYQEVFDIVTGTRDAVVKRVTEAWNNKEQIQGWMLDDVGLDYIRKAGYGDYILHRTGHSCMSSEHF